MTDRDKFMTLLNRLIDQGCAVCNEPYLIVLADDDALFFTRLGRGGFYYYYHADDSDCFTELVKDLKNKGNPFEELIEGIE